MQPSDFITNDRAYAPQKMNDLHQEILRRLLTGQSASDVARDLNISPVTVGYVRHSPLGKQKLDMMHASADVEAIDIQKRIAELAPVALETLSNIMTDPNAGATNRRQVAVDLLDRAGFSALKRVSVERGAMSREDIEEIKERARRRGLIRDDAEVEEATVVTESQPN